MNIKEFNDKILEPFQNQSLESRKKASALWGILLIVTLMGALVFAAELIFQHPWPSQAPGIGVILGFFVSFFFLRRGRLDFAQIGFLGSFLVVITAIPFLDPYNHPFELYRYAFLTSIVLSLSGTFLQKRRHIILFTLAVVTGVILVFVVRFLLPGIIPMDSVMILTLVICLIVIILIGAVAVLSLTIQKQLLDAVEEKEAQAIGQRDSYARFVPKEFLSLLNKDSIQNVELGEGVQKSGTILVADIRDFTGISETLKPREVMAFLNDWLEVAAPVIIRHRGIIDKFMGDGLLVLFPHAVEDAIEAALELFKVLGPFNEGRIGRALRPMKIGIGINFGELILGTIGSKHRMDGTVVSDAVNIAAHLESQTKFFQTPLLISREALYETLNPNQYRYRFLDTVKMKNRQNPVQVFEILDALPVITQELILQTKDQFEEALENFLKGKIEKARDIFQSLLEINPEDTPARIYLDRCETLLSSQGKC